MDRCRKSVPMPVSLNDKERLSFRWGFIPLKCFDVQTDGEELKKIIRFARL